MIDQEMKGALQGIVPSCIITCSKAGIPNATYISQVYYVDDNHVAISHQFFNKTIKNIQDNPHASVSVVDPEDFSMWRLTLDFSHSETEGDTFDQMSIQLEAIASMTGMEDIFKLKSSVIFEVKDVEKIT
jgi:hypothetical protein